MVVSVVNFDRAPKLVSFSNNCSHFKLEIKKSASVRSPLTFGLILGNLSLWSSDWGSVENYGGSSAVVPDWQVSPVWLQSVVRASEHAANVVGVVFRRIEVCVIPDENWHLHFHLSYRNGSSHQSIFVALISFCVEFLNGLSGFDSEILAQRSKFI